MKIKVEDNSWSDFAKGAVDIEVGNCVGAKNR